MAKLVDLRQTRSLIKSNFEGYKLSFNTLPIIRQDFSIPPLQARANEEQYSCLHVELFSLQNLLVADPWHRTTSYFVNQGGQVMKCSYDESAGRPKAMEPVWTVPSIENRQPGDYNISLQFVSEKFCVLSDGLADMFLIDTGDRYKSHDWKTVFQTTIFQDVRNFILKDTRLDVVDGKRLISLLLQRVIYKDSSHYTQLYWSIFKYDTGNNVWSYELKEVLEEKGSIYYAAFEPKAGSLVLSSNKEFQFASKKVAVKPCAKPKEDVFPFMWSQTDEELILKFNNTEGREELDYKVNCKENNLCVECSDEVLLDKELFSKVDPKLTKWSLEKDSFLVVLTKETSIAWPLLYLNGPPEDGHFQLENQPIANLDAPIEDCDFPLGSSEDEIIIERLNLDAQDITHKIHLGSHPPLFSTCLRPGFPNALITRQDVDACVWLQQYNATQSADWGFRHEGNLHAFAYVQASKQQKKFIDCSPDLRYGIVCESHRHVFIYESNYDTAEGLRNRNGPQVSIGKQRLVVLDDGEVLGMTTDNNVIILLTEKCLLFLQINC